MAGIIFSENSMQNDAVYGKYQAPIRLMIEKKAEQFEKESKISELFSVQKSTHFGEAYTSMTGMDDWLPVGENGSHPENGMRQGRDKLLVNETWKSAFSISREMVDDSNLIELRRRPAAFVAAYGRAKERFAASLYGAAMDGKTEITINGKRTVEFVCGGFFRLQSFRIGRKNAKFQGRKRGAFEYLSGYDPHSQ